MTRIERKKHFSEMFAYLLEGTFKFGIDGYLFFMLFIIATVGLAKIILKTCTKQNFKYSNLLLFCIIGLTTSIILKIFKLNLSQGFLETLICLIINIIVFIVFKYIKKVNESKYL